jgi:dolichyl-diphosphooligosaccharide--protein glycosyltransferase
MTDVREETAALLDERPELAADLEALLEIDEDGPWTFDDVRLDSGTFGEIVSRGIVEKEDGEYRVADREAVRAGLEGKADGAETTGRGRGIGGRELSELSLGIDRTAAAALVGALALVVFVRLGTADAVFRNGDIVLAANDPYHYRYVVEQLLAMPGFDPGQLDQIGRLPIDDGEPLMVTTMWVAALLLGGTPEAVGTVLAWYPPVTAALTGAVLYLVAVHLTRDRRVALAAVAFFAVTPIHVTRSSVGFADHHAFDGFWLAVTLLGLALVLPRGGVAPSGERRPRTGGSTTSDRPERRRWGGAAVLAVGVAGQTLAWEASPLLFVPLAGVLALSIVSAHRVDAPVTVGLPAIAGVGVGGLLATVPYLLYDWLEPPVILVPLAVTAGAAGSLATSAIFRRADWSARVLLGTLVGTGVIAITGLALLVPSFLAEAALLFPDSQISESISIVSGELGFALGPVLLFGFLFAFALPYLGWWGVVALREHRPEAIVLVVYAGYFLVLSIVQFRFGDLLVVPAAVLGGLGLVRFAAWIGVARAPATSRTEPSGLGSGRGRGIEVDGGDVDRRPEPLDVPSRRDVASYAFVGLFGLLPGAVLSPIRAGLASIPDVDYRVAKWLEGDVRERGLEYPASYVFAQWGKVRLYNYFANGDSLTYGFAREQFDGFLSSADPAGFYAEFGDRVGYVVTATRPTGDLPPDIVYRRLHQRYGSAGEGSGAPGVGHYQAAFTVADGSRKVFRVVPGATLTGSVTAGTTVSVRTSVDVGSETVQYGRRTTAGDDGQFTVRVAHSGEYGVETDDGATGTVDVPESAVYGGNDVEIGDVA